MRQPGVGAAQGLGHAGVAARESLDVHLVDHRLVEPAAERTVALPVEPIVDDDSLRHVSRAVPIVAFEIVPAEWIRKDSRLPDDVSGDRSGVGINQQFRRIAAVSLRGLPWAVHAEAVALSRTDAAQIAVPAESGPLP